MIPPIMPLNEIYFGKTTEMLKLERILEKIRIKYSRPNLNDITNGDIAKLKNDPLLVEIEDKIKRTFGLEMLIIGITRENVYNCYTFSCKRDPKEPDDIPDTKYPITINSKGMRFSKEKDSPFLLILISSGLLLSPEVTPGEIVAILLHEIGHGFTKSVIDKDKINNRLDERFADSIPIMYGYATELASISSKTYKKQTRDEYNLYKIPIVNLFVGLKNIMSDLAYRELVGEGLPHPDFICRQKLIIDQLESDLNKTPDLTTKQKKDLKDQIDKCKKELYRLENNVDDDVTMSDRIQMSYHKNIVTKLPRDKELNRAMNLTSPDKVNNILLGLYKKR